MKARRECSWCQKEGGRSFMGWTDTTDGASSHGICKYHKLVFEREIGDAPPAPFADGEDGRTWELMERGDKLPLWSSFMHNLPRKERPSYLRWLALKNEWDVDREAVNWDALASALCIGYTVGGPRVAAGGS